LTLAQPSWRLRLSAARPVAAISINHGSAGALMTQPPEPPLDAALFLIPTLKLATPCVDGLSGPPPLTTTRVAPSGQLSLMVNDQVTDLVSPMPMVSGRV
jgi:hypothetical protein